MRGLNRDALLSVDVIVFYGAVYEAGAVLFVIFLSAG